MNDGFGRNSRRLRGLAIAAGVLWTLPNSLLGLLAGACGLPFGARVQWRPRDCALAFHAWPWGPGGAMALGNVILHTGQALEVTGPTYAHRAGHAVEPWIRLDDHERAHVYQYMVLGPLYLPLYFLCGGISARNRFERAADRYALSGRGWWPWR